jgi:hypothetical protein
MADCDIPIRIIVTANVFQTLDCGSLVSLIYRHLSHSLRRGPAIKCHQKSRHGYYGDEGGDRSPGPKTDNDGEGRVRGLPDLHKGAAGWEKAVVMVKCREVTEL